MPFSGMSSSFFFAAMTTVCLLVMCNSEKNPAGTVITDNDSDSGPYMGRLQVQGNGFVDSTGNTIVLKGLCMGDPLITQYSTKQWNEHYFQAAASWGARLLRIPVNPGSYRSIGAESIFARIDSAVTWAKKYTMYLIIDWHGDGNPVEEIDQADWQATSLEEMKTFWSKAAERYKNEYCVAFYEIFNEIHQWDDGITWHEWRVMADEIIDTIYAHNDKAIPVVGGLNYCYNLTEALSDPLTHTGYAFSVHPYPGRAKAPYEVKWDRDFGFCAASHPMIFTEFGFDPNDTVSPGVFKADTVYGNAILNYADNLGISWTAWVFYSGDSWPMPLFSDWETMTPTMSGDLIKRKLQSGQ